MVRRRVVAICLDARGSLAFEIDKVNLLKEGNFIYGL